MFLTDAEEVTVVECPSLQCLPVVCVREMCPSLRMNLCQLQIQDHEWVQLVGAHCKQSDSSGMQLQGVQDGVI
jgi:hypothetical protein